MNNSKKMKLYLLLVALAHTILAIFSARVDRTLENNARGADTVRSVLSKMEQSEVFDSPSISSQKAQVNEQFMREMAFVETEDGEQATDDMQGGIWRVDSNIFKETQTYNYDNLYDLICEVFCIDWPTLNYRELSKPLYSGLTVQIYLYHLEFTGRGLPEGATDRRKAAFWLEMFHRNQQQLVEGWLRNVSQLRAIEVCRVNIDVVFVLDSSGSIGFLGYQLVREYTYNFTESLLSGVNDNRVGVILYGNSAQVDVGLDFLSRYNKETLLTRIASLQYLNEWTNTPEALCLLGTMSWRDSISTLRLAVVLTDGQSNRESMNCGNGTDTLETTSKEIHERSPQIVVSAVGVDNYVLSELQLIATSSDSVDELNSFDPNLLEQNQYYRSYSACFKVVQMVSNNLVSEGTADRGSVSRLQFSGSGQEGVFIKICIEEGGIVIYGSYTNPNPGSALYDFTEELREAEGTRCVTAHVDQNTISNSETCSSCEEGSRSSKRKKRQVEDVEVNIYVAIEGTENGSHFTVATEDGRGIFDNITTGCKGNSSLCNRDSTVLCQKTDNTTIFCECVYGTGLENLSSCETVNPGQGNDPKLPFPPVSTPPSSQPASSMPSTSPLSPSARPHPPTSPQATPPSQLATTSLSHAATTQPSSQPAKQPSTLFLALVIVVPIACVSVVVAAILLLARFSWIVNRNKLMVQKKSNALVLAGVKTDSLDEVKVFNEDKKYHVEPTNEQSQDMLY